MFFWIRLPLPGYEMTRNTKVHFRSVIGNIVVSCRTGLVPQAQRRARWTVGQWRTQSQQYPGGRRAQEQRRVRGRLEVPGQQSDEPVQKMRCLVNYTIVLYRIHPDDMKIIVAVYITNLVLSVCVVHFEKKKKKVILYFSSRFNRPIIHWKAYRLVGKLIPKRGSRIKRIELSK